MMRAVLSACALTLLLGRSASGRYEPTWASLDTRPLPGWYDEAKFGIFIHWGLFSVPSFGDEWFWEYWREQKWKPYVDFMDKNYRPNFTYADFGPQFTAEFYNPDQWADLFKASGAKYIVLTSKHHEGFTMWPSKYAWNWNAMDVGPKRDLLGDLAKSIRKRTDVKFGVYHSLFEWFNPIFLEDKKSNFTTKIFPHAKTIPELYELVENYKPDVIWSDGSIAAPSSDYWGSKDFIAWLYNDSPVKDTVVTNDRWGRDASCAHGDFFTCRDRYNPGVLLPHKWENCMTIDSKSWGYRREAVLADFLTMDDLTKVLAETISCGGNLLMNVGPTHDGRIVPIFEERLRQMGQWLGINGEAIYSSKAWHHQNDSTTSGVWYTQREKSVYAIVLDWPDRDILTLGSITMAADGKVLMLGHKDPLKWTKDGQTLQVKFPDLAQVSSRWAWVLKFDAASPMSQELNQISRWG
ncbi:alpha-L-fucosidase-like [Pollicipes pollicipes]|uniref:alpha-L-fucosidase-like n=1 Tax=Pollicipes pollicipes TaxID=41117 RepID=UPI00188543B6|nr:alpha-L-fucosidase-like [Pollicipes pollicipes]